MLRYSPRTGQYIGTDGRFVSRARVLELVDNEQRRTEVRLQGLTRRLISGVLTLPDWESEFAQELKRSHIRLAMLAAGGRDGMNSRAYGIVGANLRAEYGFLDGFANALFRGEVSEKQALARAKLYGASVRGSFFKVERSAKESEGFTTAKRELDPQAEHCADCLRHSTNGRWVAIEDVVPVGVRCKCRWRCRCSVVYGKYFDLVQIG